jgi:hypothetical protein
MKRILLSILTITVFGFGAKAQNVNLPDANFKAYLVGNTAINTNGDTEIQVPEASAFSGIFNCPNLNISDLTGIEAFTSLTDLRCYNNSITTLDLTQNTALTYLSCKNNSLTTLDVSQNTALTNLYCNNNTLTTLDVSQNIALTTLDCYNNSISSLDVSQNNDLSSLRCYNNSLTTLITQNSDLELLFCYSNALTNLDISQNTALNSLRCYNNLLTTLDLTQNTALDFIDCKNNQLTSLNVVNGNNTNFIGFDATNNPNLTCIQVDDATYSTTNWSNIDAASSFSINCNGTVGINESTTTTLNIAPNPAKDVLNISTLETVEQVTIYSISGSLVKNINQNINQINVEDLTEGMYILVIKTENGITRNRFIKE